MLLLGQGKHHQVYLGENEYVIKVPQKNTDISYEQAQKSVRFFEEEFGEFLPETKVLPGNQDYPYKVIQKRVDGILLGDFLRQRGMTPSIRSTLSRFTSRALEVLDNQIVGFDIIGTPPSPELKGRWEGCTNIIINPQDENISFVDCVIPSRAIGRSYIVNRVLQSFWYQRRKILYSSLIQDLQVRKN